MSILHSCSRKYFLNKRRGKYQYDHLLHPVNTEYHDDAEIDLLFLHGNKSHPVNCWMKMPEDNQHCETNPNIWLHDLLPEDLKGYKARVMFGGYETLHTVSDHNNHNIPNWDMDEMNDILVSSMQKAGVGERPLVVISFSMGGIIIKKILCS